MNLHGIHHVTAITGEPDRNYDFYTRVLGLRLVKKTVNQDDLSAYHLFYADKLGSPGTDITFFDWPRTVANRPGADSISRTLFRVANDDALAFWTERLTDNGAPITDDGTLDDARYLSFEDPEGQKLAIVVDDGAPFHGEVWTTDEISADSAIRGFYGVELTVNALSQVEPVLTRLLGMELETLGPGLHRFAMDGGGPGKYLFVREEPTLDRIALGRGGVHHVAFRLSDRDEQQEWIDLLAQYDVPNSGPIDRYYFRSVYFRISYGILFELATDGPGFTGDEDLEHLGETLALPPFLEDRRAEIEAGLTPIRTAAPERE
jgi:glyoxalase family protein